MALLNPFEIAWQAGEFWRNHRIGHRIGAKLFPKITARREARRAERPQTTTTEDAYMLFPRGTMTKTGAGIAMAGPVIAVALQQFGVGECTADELAQGCVGATQWATMALTILGGIIAWIGRRRAEKLHSAALEQAQQSKE